MLASLSWPVLVKTLAASVSSALFRMILTPIDTLKTTQQTQGGVAGLKLLKDRIKEHGISCLFWGAFGTAGATFVGHCEFLMCRTRTPKSADQSLHRSDPWFGVSLSLR